MNHPFTAIVDPAACLPRNPTQGTVRRPLDEREPKPLKEVQRPPSRAEVEAARVDEEVKRRLTAVLQKTQEQEQRKPADQHEKGRGAEELQVAEKPTAAPNVQPIGYVPRYGSLAWRLVTYLRRYRDIELTRVQIADQFFAARSGIDQGLMSAVAAGFLEHAAGKAGLMVWRVGVNQAELPSAAKGGAAKDPKRKAVEAAKPAHPASPAPLRGCRGKARQVLQRGVEPDLDTAAPRPFNAALWLEGGLVIYGAEKTEDGGVRLNVEQLAQVKRLIAWSPAA